MKTIHFISILILALAMGLSSCKKEEIEIKKRKKDNPIIITNSEAEVAKSPYYIDFNYTTTDTETGEEVKENIFLNLPDSAYKFSQGGPCAVYPDKPIQVIFHIDKTQYFIMYSSLKKTLNFVPMEVTSTDKHVGLQMNSSLLEISQSDRDNKRTLSFSGRAALHVVEGELNENSVIEVESGTLVIPPWH